MVGAVLNRRSRGLLISKVWHYVFNGFHIVCADLIVDFLVVYIKIIAIHS